MQIFGLLIDINSVHLGSAEFRAKIDFCTTAKVLLSRGTKQGDPAGPIVFNTANTNFLRIVAASMQAVTVEGVGHHTAGEHADDTAIITNSPTGMNHLLTVNNVLATSVLQSACDITEI